MASTWRVVTVPVTCGRCLTHDRPTVIPAGDLVLELRLPKVTRLHYRCQGCGEAHQPLTDAAIAAAQAERVAQMAREGLHEAAQPARSRSPRPPRSWASLAESTTGLFDVKAAAAGDRE